MKPITKDWIKQNKPCQEALDWYKDYLGKSPIVILTRLIKAEEYDWANWFIVRVMTYKQYVSYAVYAAEQVIDIYEKKYPNDKRPREAIEAAKECIENPNQENKNTAYAAAYAAADAVADAAAYTAYAAAYAAYAAAYAAAYVAADAAADAAAHAAAHVAADAAYAAMQKKILEYGMKLLKEETK